MKKESKFYHVGKGIKTDKRLTPMTGTPNTNLDTREKKSGKLVQRRKFGKDGNAYKDMDVAHESHQQSDHVHDIKDKARKTARKPTKKEQRELNKAPMYSKPETLAQTRIK